MKLPITFPVLFPMWLETILTFPDLCKGLDFAGQLFSISLIAVYMGVSHLACYSDFSSLSVL